MKMAKTALDLTADELHLYRPARSPGKWQGAERRARALELARRAARLLRERFGVEQVVAFGSLVHIEWFSRWSDIDLAAWNIPADQFFRAVAAVTSALTT